MESEYKKENIFFGLVYGYFFLTFTSFIAVMMIRNFIINPDLFSFSKIVLGVVSIFIFSALTILFLGTALIRNKYYQSNLKYFVEIDNKKEVLIIHYKESLLSKSINFKDVKSVELYYSWNTNSFSSDLGYSKLILFNKDFIFITQNNVNQFHIYKAFGNKIITNKSRFANPLK